MMDIRQSISIVENELLFEKQMMAQWVSSLSDSERHEWLRFIHLWLVGKFMGKCNADALQKWKTLASIVPPKVKPKCNLYRLITVPIKYANQTNLRIKPAKSLVSSWSATLNGIEYVAGIATDLNKNNARIAIKATIDRQFILATPTTMKEVFLALSHDYFDRFKEEVKTETKPDGTTFSRDYISGWPDDDSDFHLYDVGYLQDVLSRPGGNYSQNEYIVQTPKIIDATVVRKYRIGNETIRQGLEW